MVLSQIETMFASETKISVSVLDLNVIKITTTRRHNFDQSEHLPRIIPLAWLFTGKEHALGALGRTIDVTLWKVTNSLYCILITPSLSWYIAK